MVKIGRKSLIFGIALLFAGAPRLYACPGCSQLLERGKDAFKMMKFGEGIAWSMALLFSVPLILVGSLGLLIYRSQKRAKLR